VEEIDVTNMVYELRGANDLNARLGQAVEKLLDIWDEQCHADDLDADDDQWHSEMLRRMEEFKRPGWSGDLIDALAELGQLVGR
jgi:hypothetical protein